VRACDENNVNSHADPCCNQALRWSDCCVPSARNVSISGLYKGINTTVIQHKCGARAGEVAELLTEGFANVLIASQHPEYGCDAAANVNNDPNKWSKLYMPVVSCRGRPSYCQN